jgi:hypothetical protein
VKREEESLRTTDMTPAHRHQFGRARIGGAFAALSARLVLMGALVAVLSVGVASATAAPAAPAYKSTSTVFPVAQVAFAPARVAVEPGTGNVLYAAGAYGIDVYDPAGTVLTHIAVSSALAGLATDPGTGAVYYADVSGTITRYLSDGAPTPTYTADPTFTSPATGSGAGQIGSITGIAVDPTTHDLLVLDPTNDRVSRFSSTGTFVSSFDGASAPSAGFASATDIAVGPTGETLVVAAGHVDRFTAAGTSNGELADAGSPAFVAVDPVSGRIVVAADGGPFNEPQPPRLHVYKDSAATPTTAPYTAPGGWCCGAVPGSLAIDGSSSRAYGLYMDPFLGSANGLEVFDAGTKPGVELSAPSQVDATSMHLSGTVDSGQDGTLPEGVVEGVAYFELSAPGLTTVRSPDQIYTGTVGLQAIDADVSGLRPNTEYSVKLVAQNSLLSGESTSLSVRTADSPPAVVTTVATDITDSSAVLNGTVVAYGLQTTYVFEYGPTAAYGSKAPAGAPGVGGVSFSSRAVRRHIDGLQSGTTYHYRLVATNSAGTTAGADATFTASPADDVRGYEMVTPPDKGGGAIDTTYGFHARADGDAVTYHPTSGFGSVDATSSPLQSRYLALRDPATRWGASSQVDPPLLTHRLFLGAEHTTLAVSEDFSRALVVSNRKLTPDALAVEDTGGGNLYIRDTRNGSYTFVAGSLHPQGFGVFAEVSQTNPYLGGTKDFSSIVFSSDVPLTSDALAGNLGIYRWSAAGLELISRLPDGSPAPGVRGLPYNDLVQTASNGGARVIFSVVAGSPQDGVYLWEDGHTRALSVSHRAGDPNTVVPALGQGISQDGRYVTFTVPGADPLTQDAQPVTDNIYRLDLAGGGSGTLELVVNGPGVGVVRVSPDGSHVYFAGQPTPSDAAGWWVWSEDGYHFVSPPPTTNYLRFVSPNGKYLAFQTTDQLTSYDNHSNNAGRSCDPAAPGCFARAEIYLYDAVNHELSCPSCPQDGKPSPDNAVITTADIADSNRLTRMVFDDGRVLISTPTQLTAGDVNDRMDVYSVRDGRATLVSPGDGPYSASFMDASADGRDVFIATTQPLSSRDTDEEYDYYDARVGGGDSTPEPRAPCGGDECAEPGESPGRGLSAGTETASGEQVVRRAAKARLAKVRAVLTRASLRMTVRVSGRGRLRATGRHVKTTVRRASGAGTYTLSVRLGRRARSALRHHRRLRLSIRVRFATPSGASATTTFTRTLGK